MSGFKVKDFELYYQKDKSELRDETEHPSLVEGLLGVGSVGLLASNHLVRELDFEKVAEVYSSHFSAPLKKAKIPGVVYSGDGTAKLHRNEIFYDSEEDLFVYNGLYQGDLCEFYYRHANRIIDFCRSFGVESVYTLGGFGTGEEKEERRTRAVITSSDQVSQVRPHAEITRGRKDRPGVTGISGLLIGLANKNGMEGLSLLGETHGTFPDARAAKSVIDALCGIIGIEIELSGLDEVAEKLERKKGELKKKMRTLRGKGGKEYGDMRYIG